MPNTSLRAMLAMAHVDKSAVCLLVDKEEVGSQGATGMQSHFFVNALAEVMNAMGDYSELKLRRALQNSRMLSSDVSAAFDPNYASVMETNNCAYFGRGIVFNKYTGATRQERLQRRQRGIYRGAARDHGKGRRAYCRPASWARSIRAAAGPSPISWPIMAWRSSSCGVALHNMHAPWEISSKADIYETYRGYQAFLKYAE